MTWLGRSLPRKAWMNLSVVASRAGHVIWPAAVVLVNAVVDVKQQQYLVATWQAVNAERVAVVVVCPVDHVICKAENAWAAVAVVVSPLLLQL